MRENLRVENNFLLIASVLRELVHSKAVITLWQNQSGLRQTAIAMMKEINFHTRQVLLVPLRKNFQSFLSNEVLYVHTEQKSVLFKSSEMKMLKDSLFLSIPREIRLSEMRENKRICFKQEFFVPEITLGDTKGVQSFPLADLSPCGASFIIPRGDLSHFFIDEVMYIRPPSMSVLSTGIPAKIMHISPCFEGRGFSGQHFRVGVKFKDKVDLSLFLEQPKLKVS